MKKRWKNSTITFKIVVGETVWHKCEKKCEKMPQFCLKNIRKILKLI